MRLKLLIGYVALLGVLLLPMPLRAQVPNIRQSNLGNGSSCALNKPVLNGSMVGMFLNWRTSTSTPTISDSRGTTLTQQVLDTTNTLKVALYSGLAPSAGSDTFTYSVSGNAGLTGVCMEFTGIPGTLDVASAVTTFSSTGTITTGSVTTTQNRDLLIACTAGGNSNMENQSPYDAVGFNSGSSIVSGGGCEFRVAGAIGSYSATFGNPTSTAGTMFLLAYLPTALNIATTTLPDGAQTLAYDFCIPYAGGVSSLTWSILSGTPQTGLSLNSSTGCITGTPSVSSTVSLDIQIDDGSSTSHQVLSLKVAGSLNTPALLQATTFNSGSATFSSTVANGSFMLLALGGNGITIQTCTDSVGTVYTYFASATTYRPSGVGQGAAAVTYYAGISPSSGLNTVSCGGSSLGVSNNVAMEFSNIYSASDNIGVTNGLNGATITSDPLTTLVPNELLVGECMGNSVGSIMTAQSPFTVAGGSSVNPGVGYDLATTVTGYTITCSMSSNTDGHWNIILAGFRPTGGAVVIHALRIRGQIY